MTWRALYVGPYRGRPELRDIGGGVGGSRDRAWPLVPSLVARSVPGVPVYPGLAGQEEAVSVYGQRE